MKTNETPQVKHEYHAPVYNINVAYVEKQINGDYHEYHLPDGKVVEGKVEGSPTPNALEKKKAGPPKRYLFIKNGADTNENAEIKRREVARFKSYIASHKLGNRTLNTQADDTLNKVVCCFWKKWHDMGIVKENPVGNAIFRFLTEDCEIKSDIQEKSYGNKISKMILGEERDIVVEADVDACFEK